MKEKSNANYHAHQYARAGGVYLVTYVGAAVYFIQNSHGLLGFLWALVKALVWPGILVHRVFQLLRI